MSPLNLTRTHTHGYTTSTRYMRRKLTEECFIFQSSISESASSSFSFVGVINRRKRVLQTPLPYDFRLYFEKLLLQISRPHSGKHQHPLSWSEQVGRGNFCGDPSHSRLQEPTESGSCTAALYAVSYGSLSGYMPIEIAENNHTID